MAPEHFDSWGLHYFAVLVNLQELAIVGMDFSRFPSGTEKYFGHFSPTLRSITLRHLKGSPGQLVDFLGLFPKLDDINIVHYFAAEAPETPRTPVQGSLRGKLALSSCSSVRNLFEEIITTFGGMRFISLDLDNVPGTQLILDACAGTLQTLRLNPNGVLHCRKGFKEGGTTSELTDHGIDSHGIVPSLQPVT